MDKAQIYKILHGKATNQQRKMAVDELYKQIPESDLDYDYKGAIQAGLIPDDRGHWSDQFKKANHITASVESKYNTAEKPFGKWVKLDKPEATGEEWAFEPTEYQIKQFGESKYKDYFNKYESGKNGAIVRFPQKTVFDKMRGLFNSL